MPFRRLTLALFAVLMLAAPIAGVALAQTDEQYVRYWKQEWPKTNFEKRSVEFSEILHGGPPKDGIPPIDEPAFVSVSEAQGIEDHQPVIGVVINGEAKAYPLTVLMWH